MKPNPTELEAAINPEAHGLRQSVESHRHLFCHHYDDCLDEAVVRGWNSWTCSRCPLNPGPDARRSVKPRLAGGLEDYATQRRTA